MCFCAWAWILWASQSGLADDGAPADPAYPGAGVAVFQPWPQDPEGLGSTSSLCRKQCPVRNSALRESSLPPGRLRNPSCVLSTEETEICSSWGNAKQEWKCSLSCHIHHAWAGLHHCFPCLPGVVQDVISHFFILIQRLWWDLSTHLPFQYQGAAFSNAFTCTVDVALNQTLPVWACEQGV